MTWVGRRKYKCLKGLLKYQLIEAFFSKAYRVKVLQHTTVCKQCRMEAGQLQLDNIFLPQDAVQSLLDLTSKSVGLEIGLSAFSHSKCSSGILFKALQNILSVFSYLLLPSARNVSSGMPQSSNSSVTSYRVTLTCNRNGGMKANSLGRPIKPCNFFDRPCPKVQPFEQRKGKIHTSEIFLCVLVLRFWIQELTTASLLKCECASKLARFNCSFPRSKFSFSRLAVYPSFIC